MARVYAIVIFILAQGLCGQVQAAAQFTRDGTILRLANGAITTTFNLTSGEWEVLLADGTVFAANLLCALDLDGVLLDTRQGPPVFSFARVRRPYGGGVRLEIQRGHDRAFLLILTMYDADPFFLVQVRLADTKGVRLREVTVPQGKIFMARDPLQLRVLANGENGGATEIQGPDLSALRNLWTTTSDFCFCALDQASGKSVVLGALFARASNRIEAQVDAQQDPHALDFKARCFYQAGPASVETGPWESPPYFFAAPASVFDGLELYGEVAKAWRPEPLSASVPTGWCSRDTLAARSQDHLFANVAAIQTHRLNDYGLRFVQLDDGWQQGAHCSGNWWPRSERFPLGMRAIGDAIQGRRLVPGLWFGPFGEDPPQANQPTLFANSARGGYDLSSQRFRAYLDQELKRLVEDWGYHYLKADCLASGTVGGIAAPVETAFLESVQSIQQAVQPPGGYLVTAGNSAWLTAGYTDGQRLGQSVPSTNWAGLCTAARDCSRRYFTLNNWWIGDPDLLHVALPTERQSQAWATFIALAGGATMVGDDLTQLSATQMTILKKALPGLGIPARPCDLFDYPIGWSPKLPRIWDCKVRSADVGLWDVVGLFNWNDTPGETQNLTLDFAKHLQLDPSRRVLVYDFWRQQYLGAFERKVIVGIPAGGCHVLVLREEEPAPQVLGDDRHILSGAEALRQVRWDPSAKTLSGLVRTVRNISYQLGVHVPKDFLVERALVDGSAAEVKAAGEYAMFMTFSSGAEGKASWVIHFRNAARPPEATANSLVSRIEVPSPTEISGELPLRQLVPLWTDPAHDGPGLADPTNDLDLNGAAPFWIHWNISNVLGLNKRLRALVEASQEGRVFFEVTGDGRALFASPVLAKGEKVALDVRLEGVNELGVVCHTLDSSPNLVQGIIRHPRLIKE